MRKKRKVCLSETEADMYEVLMVLRYLSTDQIARLWFPDRSRDSVRRRLQRLRDAGELASVYSGFHRWCAWRLTAKGIAHLREVRNGDFQIYQGVQEQFLDHLLETNSVWMMLAGAEPSIRSLPFGWEGSHRAALPFLVPRIDGRRNRLLIPDAIIEHQRSGARVFLELDRSTETIKDRRGRRSIEGKLKTYRSAMVLPQPGKRRSAYADAYADGRKPRVVFVLTKDPRSRRMQSILSVARDICPQLDVCVVPLADEDAVRPACLNDAVPRTPAPAQQAHDNAQRMQALWRVHQTLYREAVLALEEAGVDDRHAPDFQKAARRVRAHLETTDRFARHQAVQEAVDFHDRALSMLQSSRDRDTWPHALERAIATLRVLSPTVAKRFLKAPIEPR